MKNNINSKELENFLQLAFGTDAEREIYKAIALAQMDLQQAADEDLQLPNAVAAVRLLCHIALCVFAQKHGTGGNPSN